MGSIPTQVPQVLGSPEGYGQLYAFVAVVLIFTGVVALIVYWNNQDRKTYHSSFSSQLKQMTEQLNLERQDRRSERESLVSTIESQANQFADAIEKHDKVVVNALNRFSDVIAGCPNNSHNKNKEGM